MYIHTLYVGYYYVTYLTLCFSETLSIGARSTRYRVSQSFHAGFGFGFFIFVEGDGTDGETGTETDSPRERERDGADGAAACMS